MGEYHEPTLYQGIQSKLVNIDNSNFPGLFGNTTTPASVNPNILPEPASNVMALHSKVACSGGGRRKRCNLPRKYKSMRRHKPRVRPTRRRRSRRTRTRRRHRGGYSQYQNNMPYTPNYALGGTLSASESALANPPPIMMNTKGNCVDNYNYNTNTGFPSRGWH